MNPRLLIVEDDVALCEALNEFLLLSKFHVSSVSSSEEALDHLKTNRIDIVITDIRLQGMNGLVLTERIRQHYETDVVVMTGYSDDHSYEDAISKGASDFIFKPVRFEELLLRLKRVLRERELTKERFEMLEKLNKLAITDGLTKLFNSRHFYDQLDIEVDRFNRYSHSLSLLLLDLDHFKEYNDGYGHIEGDKVLAKFGAIIKSCLRKMDTAYRYGGEEFTAILPETNHKEALVVAERIRKTIEKQKFSPEKGDEKTITVSVGVAEYSTNEKVSEFVQRADKAMYNSKKEGRNKVSFLPS